MCSVPILGRICRYPLTRSRQFATIGIERSRTRMSLFLLTGNRPLRMLRVHVSWVWPEVCVWEPGDRDDRRMIADSFLITDRLPQCSQLIALRPHDYKTLYMVHIVVRSERIKISLFIIQTIHVSFRRLPAIERSYFGRNIGGKVEVVGYEAFCTGRSSPKPFAFRASETPRRSIRLLPGLLFPHLAQTPSTLFTFGWTVEIAFWVKLSGSNKKIPHVY